jgi:hypothetical protein
MATAKIQTVKGREFADCFSCLAMVESVPEQTEKSGVSMKFNNQ